ASARLTSLRCRPIICHCCSGWKETWCGSARSRMNGAIRDSKNLKKHTGPIAGSIRRPAIGECEVVFGMLEENERQPGLVHRLRFSLQQFGDLVFQLKFSSFQLSNPNFIRCRVRPFLRNFTVEIIMATLKFSEMTLHRHSALLSKG